MTDRERLIELITKEVPRPKADALAIRILANGVIVPPCKVGDMIYMVGIFTGQVVPCEVVGIETTQNDMFLILANQAVASVVYQLGKTVFLTKEEAEEKLKELNNNA